MMKKKIAFYWCAACGGCEVSVLDIDEMILDVIEKADIVFWPCAMDPKYEDLEAMEDEEIDIAFINGSIRSEENKEMVELIREKAKKVVAYGSCSSIGGLFGLGNLSSKEELIEVGYSTRSTDDGVRPQNESKVEEGELELPSLLHHVVPLDRVIEVDHYLPGCPPLPVQLEEAFTALLGDEDVGKYDLISQKSVCDVCAMDREEKRIEKIRPIQEVSIDPEKCILDQGVLCMGPATAGMCEAPCPSVAAHPCVGCNGPVRGMKDQGSRMLSALASVVGIEGEENMEEDELQEAIDSIRDPTGSFYTFSLPSSYLQYRRGDVDG